MIGTLLDFLQVRLVLRVIDYIFGWCCLAILLSFPFMDPRGPKRMIARCTPASLASKDGDLAFTLHAEKPVALSAKDSIRPGDFIVSNHCSVVDFLYFWWRWSARVGGDWNRFRVLFSFGSVNFRNVSSDPAAPVVLFAEETTTNCRGVLQFQSKSLPANLTAVRIHLICLKYSCVLDPTASGVSGLIWQFARLAGSLKNGLNARMISASALQSINRPGLGQELTPKVLQQLVAALGHLRPLSLSSSDKRAFLQKFK